MVMILTSILVFLFFLYENNSKAQHEFEMSDRVLLRRYYEPLLISLKTVGGRIKVNLY